MTTQEIKYLCNVKTFSSNYNDMEDKDKINLTCLYVPWNKLASFLLTECGEDGSIFQ